MDTPLNRYTTYLATLLDVGKSIKVVFDASNGPAGMVLKGFLPATSLIIPTIINDSVDPDFSAHGPNPLNPGAQDQCIAKIRETNADLGIIFDADGDRALFIDNTGRPLDSYQILMVLSRSMKPPYIAEELVYSAVNFLGVIDPIHLKPCRVGSLFVKELMKEHKASLGVELSGHYYFNDFFGLDSGIVAAIKVINALSHEQKSLSDLIASFPKHIQILDTITMAKPIQSEEVVTRMRTLIIDPNIDITTRDGATVMFPEFWINVRPSNTEPVLRVTAGGSDEAQIRDMIERVRQAFS